MAGFVLWFTGLSGSGKSTLAALVSNELARRGVHVERLDGDDVRRHLSQGLGFSREGRDENVRRIGFVAKLVERCGACAVVSVISPYAAARDDVKSSAGAFVLVFTDCAMSVLVARDTKGLYERALAGELRQFSGVSDPYEAPTNADVHLHTDVETEEQSFARIMTHLEERALVRSAAQ